MATLQIVPNIPQRPADLIRVAVPRLNKCDWIEEYLTQMERRDYDITWARIEETKVLTCAEWNGLMHGLLEDRDWLAGKGGASSWAFDFGDTRDGWLSLTESQRETWRSCSYLHVIAVQCAGATIYIDPEGYDYARYVAFDAAERPEGKTREELCREEAKATQAARIEELRRRIANPPAVPADHGIRFLWNGIKINGELFKCWYSFGNLDAPHPADTVSVTARDWKHFPEEVRACFHVENDSDSQSDYFDEDRLRIYPNHPLYALAKAAYDACEAHHQRRMAKRGLQGSR